MTGLTYREHSLVWPAVERLHIEADQLLTVFEKQVRPRYCPAVSVIEEALGHVGLPQLTVRQTADYAEQEKLAERAVKVDPLHRVPSAIGIGLRVSIIDPRAGTP